VLFPPASTAAAAADSDGMTPVQAPPGNALQDDSPSQTSNVRFIAHYMLSHRQPKLARLAKKLRLPEAICFTDGSSFWPTVQLVTRPQIAAK